MLGTSPNDVHFQAYLLDDVSRWNQARSQAAIDAPPSNFRSFDCKLQSHLDHLSRDVFQRPFDPLYCPPSTNTYELFGIEYLYTEEENSSRIANLDDAIEEGLENMEDPNVSPVFASLNCDEDDFGPELDFAIDAFVNDLSDESDNGRTADSKDIEGFDKVFNLARFLGSLPSSPITDNNAKNIVHLYDQLSSYDKKPLT